MLGAMWNELTEGQKEMWKQRAKEENETGTYKRYAIARDQERRRNMATSSIEENLLKMVKLTFKFVFTFEILF